MVSSLLPFLRGYTTKMSDNTPTLQKLLKALKTLDDWFIFGIKLSVPFSQLKKIESSYTQRELERCKTDMLQYWLDNRLVPKWNEVILALEETDQLALAAQIKHDYLWSASAASKEGDAPESSASVPATSPASHSCSSASTPPLATDEIKAEIIADVTVVSNLKDLEISFGRMIVRVKRHLDKCDLPDAKLFLYSAIGTKVFSSCENFGELLEKLQQDHIDVFNVSILQQLVACFDNHEQTEVIKAYNEKKEEFLKQTKVLEFQRAVVSRVEPILTSGKAVVTITISKEMAYDRTLKDIEKLAMEGFEECQKKFIRLHAEPGSIIISWVFPKGLSGRLEQLACDNAAVFKDNGVVEVTVGGRRVFPCTQQKDMANLQDVSEKEEKSKLKQLYIEFYSQLVEAVSDPDTCRSLTTQLHSTSLLSEEKKAALSSSLASGRSFLKVLGVEEEPHLVTVLMEKMSAVKQLQTLSEDMSGWLSESKQEAADAQFMEKEAHYERSERQQLEADNERLTRDKTDLLSRLRCCEENLKTANELSRMREKAISGMQMAAVHRRDTDVEEREESISHLKKELGELKRNELESGERESLLTREMKELNSKLSTKTDELDEAIKSKYIYEERMATARDEAIAEQQKCHKEFLKRLFPSVEVEEEEYWLSVFEKKVTEEGRRKEQELAEVRSRAEEYSQNAEGLRTALLSTKGKLDLLQNKCVEREENLSEQLQEAIAAKQELERQLDKETVALTETRGKLESVTVNEQQRAATAEETERLAAKNKELSSQIVNKNDMINALEVNIRNFKDIVIESLPSSSGKSERLTYLTRLTIPLGMAISQQSHLIVAEAPKHCITIINTASGEVINRFGQEGSREIEFISPTGVSLMHNGQIVVADSGNHRLQVVTVEGAFVAAVGSFGSQPLQFSCPSDVAIDDHGQLFVVEISNHRVQVLNPDLSYSHCFGSAGDKPGELNCPRGIAIDRYGMVYVSDNGNRRIQKFTLEGNPLAIFDPKPFMKSFSPYGLCIDNNNILYAADWANSTVLCVFNTSGQFLGYIGNDDGSSFEYPHFIVTDKGRLYISDRNGVITHKCYQ